VYPLGKRVSTGNPCRICTGIFVFSEILDRKFARILFSLPLLCRRALILAGIVDFVRGGCRRVTGYLVGFKFGWSGALSFRMCFPVIMGERKETLTGGCTTLGEPAGGTLRGGSTTLGERTEGTCWLTLSGLGNSDLSVRRAALVAVPRVRNGPAGAGLRNSWMRSVMAATALSSEEVAGRSYFVGKNWIVLPCLSARVFVTKML